ncbi:phage tail protein, partial [Leifsonia sp. SIMBA_070]
TERKSRYTFAQVGWNDPANQYKAAVEPVQDDEGVARYGIVKASITAFGTTSQGQAHRLGLWTLVSSRVETQAVSF